MVVRSGEGETVRLGGRAMVVVVGGFMVVVVGVGCSSIGKVTTVQGIYGRSRYGVLCL